MLDQLSAMKINLINLKEQKERYEQLKLKAKAIECRNQIETLKNEITKLEAKSK